MIYKSCIKSKGNQQWNTKGQVAVRRYSLSQTCQVHRRENDTEAERELNHGLLVDAFLIRISFIWNKTLRQNVLLPPSERRGSIQPASGGPNCPPYAQEWYESVLSRIYLVLFFFLLKLECARSALQEDKTMWIGMILSSHPCCNGQHMACPSFRVE